MVPKRKLKVIVGPRQRARRVRLFVDNHLNVDGEDAEVNVSENVREGVILSENIRDSVSDNLSENVYVPSEDISEETSDSELDFSSFDIDSLNYTESNDDFINEGADSDSSNDVEEESDWDIESEIDAASNKIDSQKLFKRRLCHWVVDSNIPRESVSKLLRVLRTENYFSFLPKTYKTLLGTPRNVNLIAMSPGWYHGCNILDAIIASLNSINAQFLSENVEVKMLVGCDGTPLGKSTNSQLWPILGRLCLDEAEPFDLGFYHGHAKPDDANVYLKHFRDQILELMTDGFNYNGCRIRIGIKAFCCDAPACSFIKNVKPCGSYYGCMKCEAEGEYVENISRRGGRVTYPETDGILRTDESFREREQVQHHTGLSILESLPIDMVDSFCIDPMHLVYLGVMRKLLYCWMHGRRTMKVRLTMQTMMEISNILVKISKFISVEFDRKTRKLEELSRFKATEFRLLLLYIFPIILKNRLPEEVYQHFILLHVAIRILSCQKYSQDEANVDYANSLLVLFINKSVHIYGEQFISYNVHNLQHLGEECKRFGSLELFSCFAFENHLGKLKNLVRKSAKPLQQLVNRCMEIQSNPNILGSIKKNARGVALLCEHRNGPMVNGLRGNQFEKVLVKKLRLSIKIPNNCVVLKNDCVVLIENFVEKSDGQINIIGKRFLQSGNLYHLNELNSKTLGTQVVHDLSENLEFWNLDSISNKALKIPIVHNSISNCFGIASLLNFDL
jgi:hypothetical protein